MNIVSSSSHLRRVFATTLLLQLRDVIIGVSLYILRRLTEKLKG